MEFAVITSGGRQYRVAEGDTIDIDLLDAEVGKQIVVSDVLVHVDGDKITHGHPIPSAKITAEPMRDGYVLVVLAEPLVPGGEPAPSDAVLAAMLDAALAENPRLESLKIGQDIGKLGQGAL